MKLIPPGLVAALLLISCASPSSPVEPPQPLLERTGEVSTLIATNVSDIALDRHGRLYVAVGEEVRRFDSVPAVGSIDLEAGKLLMNDIRFPVGLAVGPDDALWVLGENNRLLRRTPSGAITRFELPVTRIDWNSGIAVDKRGNAYVAIADPSYAAPSDGSHYIAKVTPEGVISVFAGQPGTGGGDTDGPGASASFYRPMALAFDDLENLYVADVGNYSIRRITPDGVVTTVAGKGRPSLPPSPMPGLPSPDLAPYFEGTVLAHGLAVDAQGNLYFSGADNRIHRVTRDGVQSVLAGNGRYCPGPVVCSDICPTPYPLKCDEDGPATVAEFDHPTTLVADRGGTLYVLDGGPLLGLRVRRVR